MATKKQKQELIDTLKWTPRTYTVQLGAYGGETYAGRVDREIYEFFKAHKIDIEQYASDWDDEKWDFVPENMRPFPPGAPFECENLFHCSGATMDASNMIEVFDENNNVVWSCSLSPEALENADVQVECFSTTVLADEPEGTVMFWGGQGEKGLCFGGEINLKQPFDPKKLRIVYEDCDGWPIANFVEYDGEDVDNNDYSTTGKWGDAKWIIAGSEEVYEGEYRDDEDDEEGEGDSESDVFDAAAELDKIIPPYTVTEWFEKSVKPVRKGEYEVMIDAPWPAGGLGRADWTGRGWKHNGEKVKIHQWRGITEDLS